MICNVVGHLAIHPLNVNSSDVISMLYLQRSLETAGVRLPMFPFKFKCCIIEALQLYRGHTLPPKMQHLHVGLIIVVMWTDRESYSEELALSRCNSRSPYNTTHR